MSEFISMDRKFRLAWFYSSTIEAKYVSLSISYESRLSTCLIGNNSSQIRDSYCVISYFNYCLGLGLGERVQVWAKRFMDAASALTNG